MASSSTPSSAAAVAAVVLACCVLAASAQDAEPQSECYSAASIVGAVIGSVVVLLGLEAGAYLLWRLYWRSRRGQHLVLVTDPEKGGDYAFDNPCFKDATPVSKAMLDSKEPAKMDQKTKWTSWGGLGGLGGLGAIKNNLGGLQGEKRRAMDDSFTTEPQVTQVSLRSHDFTGLGFNICGNMRDGIFVKDVLHRGPASESGHIFPGDRIHGIRISLRHMVFEDALTILSYASPYEVSLEVESGTAGAGSRPSSLLRREKEKEALAQADRIVHPFYRSQSIADLAQIGKGTQKRAHAIDSPSRSPRSPHSQRPRSATPSDYPTLKLSPGAHAAHAAHAAHGPHGLHTSTPHAPVAHVRLEQASAVIAPSSNVAMAKPERTGVHKLGVRVLPPREPSEKRQNVHNAYLERGIDVPDGYNPYAPAQPAQPAASGPPSPRGFHDVDLGGHGAAPAGASSPVTPTTDDHHRMGIVAKEVKTKISKGLHNLLHSLDRAGKKGPAKDEADGPAAAETTSTSSRSTPRTSPRASPDAAVEVEIEVEAEVMTRKASGRGIPTEIPEEVRLAAMAARSNRKSLASLASLAEATVAVVETDSRSSSPGHGGSADPKQQQQPKRNKGLAPRPPSAGSEVRPEALAEAPPAAPAQLVNGDESMQSDSDSECVVTVHSVHSVHAVLQDEEKTRKAASLGDLSRIEDKLSAMAVLERAVSLDLDAPAGHGKKRKAPAQPDDDGDLLSRDAGDEIMIVARKEPRLDSVGLGHGFGLGIGHGFGHGMGLGLSHGLSTFERSRLKKSSDWGTLEEALMDDGVHVTASSTAPTVAEVIPKSEARNSFFVGMMTRGQDQSDEQPFSFSASSLEPLSIEVRGEESPVPAAASASAPTSDERAERDRVLWSVPGADGASHVSVEAAEPAPSVGVSTTAVSVSSSSAPSVAEAVSSVNVSSCPAATSMEAVSSVSVGAAEAVTSVSVGARSTPASPPPSEARGSVSVSSSPSSAPADPSHSGPSSLTIVSSTPMRPDMGPGVGGIATAVQSPIVTSSDIHRAAGFAGFVSTTQLNSLEDVAFLSAVDSSTLMHDAMGDLEDDDDDDDDDVATPSPPDLPSSPMPVSSPMSSLTYVTEIQVTTPEPTTPVAKVLNGFSSPPGSPEAGSPRTARAASGDDATTTEATTATATAATPTPAARLNGDVREASPVPASSAAPSTTAPSSASSTPKAGRNVSVTNIQGSRIPVRAASHSPEDRGGRGAAGAAGAAQAGAGAGAGPGVRPPVPARRSTDPSLSPRKANGANGSVQVVSAHLADDTP